MNRYYRIIDCMYDEALQYHKTHPEVKSVHGAVLFYRHKPVSRGFSRPDRTAVRNKCCGYSIHAEEDVFLRSHHLHREKATEILVFRCRKDGNLANSRCCSQCLMYLSKTGIQKVIYTTDLGTLEVERLKDMITDGSYK